MVEILGISSQVLLGQLLLGLINGAFYAMLSLGLAVIFGMLNIINFTHGAQYMLGAFVAWLMLTYAGIGYWPALIIAPLIVGIVGIAIERIFLQHVYRLDHLYGLLLTFGLALIIEGAFAHLFGSAGQPYPMPAALEGGANLGFMYLPIYRAWVIVASLVICFGTWFLLERTSLGAKLRAATENPALVRALGINVPRLITLTYGFGAGLAALAGVMAAPVYQVSPMMASNVVIVVFAVVVIGGMGSILGAIVSGFALGLVEGLTKTFYPEASNVVIFLIMALVLLLKPTGLFGRARAEGGAAPAVALTKSRKSRGWMRAIPYIMLALALIAPFYLYPIFLMKALCFALFACAFNLLIGYVGLLSFGHAAFFGAASYTTAHAAKIWGLSPELAILFGTSVAAAVGLVFGWLAIRRQGIYFAMVTLGLAQMVYFYALQAPFTGGEDGIQAVPRGKLFGLIDLSNPHAMYYFVLAIFLFGFAVIYRTVHSPFGQILKAIRENEPRAISLGYKTDQYKLVAFTLSAALAGLAGGTKSIVLQLATLSDVHWSLSGDVVLMTLVGGLGTISGPVFGAFFFVMMQNYLAELGSWIIIIQGVIFVVAVLTFRRGVVGEIIHYLNTRGSPASEARPPAEAEVAAKSPG